MTKLKMFEETAEQKVEDILEHAEMVVKELLYGRDEPIMTPEQWAINMLNEEIEMGEKKGYKEWVEDMKTIKELIEERVKEVIGI